MQQRQVVLPRAQRDHRALPIHARIVDREQHVVARRGGGARRHRRWRSGWRRRRRRSVPTKDGLCTDGTHGKQ
eukprot:4106108-Prymnesium_polylepis.2